MAEPVTGVARGVTPTESKGVNEQDKQVGGRTFERVLRQDGKREAEVNPPDAPDPMLERMQNDLRQRLSQLPPGEGVRALLPELIDTRTRVRLLGEALGGAPRHPSATEWKGRFEQIEGEWQQLEKLMRSDREFTPGELLGLQAQLYRVSQHVEVLSKVIDQVTGGIKTILNTNV